MPRPSDSDESKPGGRLPPSLPPRGLKRVWAAAYIGVSPTKFDEMVDDGRMPKPKRIDGRTVWDRKALDDAFDALPDDAGAESNPWDVASAA
jgi:predicted DNA-binding transcriptional regulator AlpA